MQCGAMYHGSSVVAAKTVVVDNGGGFIKAGYSTDKAPKLFHNAKAVSRANKSYFIGDGIDACPNPDTLYIKRAFEKVRAGVYGGDAVLGFLLPCVAPCLCC
jgi:hypothetical protein